jgi:uncharacterized protein
VKLHNRTRELSALTSAWERADSGAPQLVLVTGRRRVGKSFLLGHFSGERRSVVHVATREAMPIQLRAIATEVVRVSPGSLRPSVDSWHEAFSVFGLLAQTERLLVVIDEVPYLHDVDPAWGTVVQAAWDRIAHGPPTRLMVVLTGSSRRVMETLTGGNGPLYGRASLNLRVEPITPAEVAAFLPELDDARRFEAFAATGGYPMHLNAWDPNASTARNLLELAGAPGSILFDNARLILAEEFPGGMGYERVLASIGMGRRRFSDIASDAGIRIEGPLATLEHIGLVEAERPVGSPRRAAALYRIADPYLAFWFNVLARVRGPIEMGAGNAALKSVDQAWQNHVAAEFENAARKYLVHMSSDGRLTESTVGRWWGRANRSVDVEIDAVGLYGKQCVFAAEVKWQQGPIVSRDVAALAAKANAVFGDDPNRVLVTVSRGGVDTRVDQVGHVHVSLREMMTERS